MTRPCPQCATACDESHRFCPNCGARLDMGAPSGDFQDPLLNRTLPGGYVILELVGIGGMGRVYRAEQKTLGRTVAVKVVHPHLLGDESAAARFITEARAASRLNHPNSVGVIDFGKTDDGQLYLVMEFLRGRDLARVAYDEGPLPIPRILDIMRQTLAALAEAHHLGIVHRDLKPENIVLERLRSGKDFVKVVDFGLAKMAEGPRERNITSPGIICGTPDYLAPEQGRGAPIDARTDIYSVGVILFQLLTRRLPFEADSPTQVVLMHMTLSPPDPRQLSPERNIPEALSQIVLRTLAKNPEDRFACAEDLSAALVGLEDGTARGAAPVMCPACGQPMPRAQKFCGDCGVRLTFPPDAQTPTSPPPAHAPSPLSIASTAGDMPAVNDPTAQSPTPDPPSIGRAAALAAHAPGNWRGGRARSPVASHTPGNMPAGTAVASPGSLTPGNFTAASDSDACASGAPRTAPPLDSSGHAPGKSQPDEAAEGLPRHNSVAAIANTAGDPPGVARGSVSPGVTAPDMSASDRPSPPPAVTPRSAPATAGRSSPTPNGNRSAEASPARAALTVADRPQPVRLALPLTERDDDLCWLLDHVVARGATVTAIRLVGPAGVGKTRLLHEFLKRAQSMGCVVVETGPDPFCADVSYHAARKAVLALSGMDLSVAAERDSARTSPEARCGLDELFGRSDSEGRVLSPAERRYATAEALRWALTEAGKRAAGGNVVLAIDDLNQVDGASRNMFADALAKPPLVPALVIAAHTTTFDPGWPIEDGSRTLVGLSVAKALELGHEAHLDRISVPANDGTATILPLYLDQLASFAAEGGSDPPGGLADLIALRIERLAPAARRVLQAIAVLGDDLDPMDVEAIVPVGAMPRTSTALPKTSAVMGSIGALMARRLIERGPSGLRHAHPLLREIVIGTIPAAVRRELHARAARIAETKMLPIEVRALHALHAQDTFEALLLVEQVADRAMGRGDAAGATVWLNRALELARRELFRGELEDPMRAVLIFSRKLGEALVAAGDLVYADGVLREALDLAGPSGTDRAKVLRALARVAHERGRYDEAEEHLTEALEQATRSGERDLVDSLVELREAWVG